MIAKRKRAISFLLTVCMLLTLLPLTAFAATTTGDTGTQLTKLWAEGAENEARTKFDAKVVNGAELPSGSVTSAWEDGSSENYGSYVVRKPAEATDTGEARIELTFTVNEGGTAYLSFDCAVSGFYTADTRIKCAEFRYYDCTKAETGNEDNVKEKAYGHNEETESEPQWESKMYVYGPGEHVITFAFTAGNTLNKQDRFNTYYYAGYLRNLKITDEEPESTKRTLTVECDSELADLYVDSIKQEIKDGKVVIDRIPDKNSYTLKVEKKDGCHFLGWQQYNLATGEYENRDPQNQYLPNQYTVTFTDENESATYRANIVKKEQVEVKIVHPGENGEYLSGYDGTNATLQYNNSSTEWEWVDIDPDDGSLNVTTYNQTQFRLVQKTGADAEAYCKSMTFQETGKSEDDTPSESKTLISSAEADGNGVIGKEATITPTSSGMLCVDLTTKSFVNVDLGDVSVYNVKSTQTRAHLPWTADDEGLRSGNTDRNRSVSVLKLELNGNGRLVFDYKVSSEVNDVLSYAVGGLEDEPTDFNQLCGSSVYNPENNTNTLGNNYLGSGIVDWTTKTIDFNDKAGQTFCVYIVYAKDSTSTQGDDKDCAWVRNIAYVDPNSSATVTVVSSNDAMGTVSLADKTNDNTYNCGTPLTATAAPNDGYVFYGWTVTDSNDVTRLVSTNAEYPFIVTQNATVTAVFQEAGYYVARTGSAFYASLDSALNATSAGIIRVINNCTLSTTATLRSGVTLLLPFDETDPDGYDIKTDIVRQPTIYYDSSLSAVIKKTEPYVTVTVAEGATLNVEGKVIVGGVRHSAQHDAQGQTSGAYSTLTVNGTVDVKNKGYLDVNGLVNGKGKVEVNSGGEARIPYLILDYAGGVNTLNLFVKNTFPFGQYATMNVQCDLVVHSGGKVTGSTSLYFFSASTTQDVPLVGTNEGLIQLASGATLTASYDASKSIKNTSVKQATNSEGKSYNYLATTGGNISLDPFGKTTISITGGATAGSFNLQGYTSSGMYLNIPYTYDLILGNGDYVLPYYYRIMPGATVTVNSDAKLLVKDISSGLQVVDGWYSVEKSGKNYPSTEMLKNNGFNTNGRLIVNGTLEIGTSATFGGIVSTQSADAEIITGNGAFLEGKDSKGKRFFGGSDGGYVNNYSEYDLTARIIVDGQEQQLMPYSTYKSSSGESKFTITSFKTNYYSTADDGKAQWNEGKVTACDQAISGEWGAPITLTFVIDEANGCEKPDGWQGEFQIVSGTSFDETKVKEPKVAEGDSFAGWYMNTGTEEAPEYTLVKLEEATWTENTTLYAFSTSNAPKSAVEITVTSYYAMQGKTDEGAESRFTHDYDSTAKTLTVTKNTTDAAPKSGKGYTYVVELTMSDGTTTTLTAPTEGKKSTIDTTATYDLSNYDGISSIKIVAVRKGDVSLNNNPTSSASSIISNALKGNNSAKNKLYYSKYSEAAADVNLDGSLTSGDSSIISNALKGNNSAKNKLYS